MMARGILGSRHIIKYLLPHENETLTVKIVILNTNTHTSRVSDDLEKTTWMDNDLFKRFTRSKKKSFKMV